MKPVAITFGRMNPPTIGHQKLVDHLHGIAKKHGADAEVHLSHTQDRKKNPLSHSQKVGLARKAFGDSVKSGSHKTIIDVMKHLHKQGRKEVHVVVGGDRHKEMHELLHRYNGKEYHFDKIHVHSAGERDPDAEGAEGMSASKMREHAKNNNHEGFKSGLPEKLKSSSHKVMKMVRTGMGHIEEYDMFGGGTSAFTPADREMPQTAVSMQHEDDPDGDDEPQSSEAIGVHDELNPALFADDRLMPEVRIQLRKIADTFIRSVGVPLDVKDIVFTGSNASYHYTMHSDIDLHVIVKLKGGASMRAYMRQLFDAKKSIWNQAHKIHIRGFEVELYIEPTEEPAVSSGVYSIMKDAWVKHPTNERPTLDDVSVRSKYRQYKDEIDTALRTNDVSEIDALLSELRIMRSSGLAKGGEYSVENIVYKLLRARGDLQKLFTARSELGDKELSMEGHKYFAGLSKGTASKRAAQFDRQTKMSDSDPSAYKPAPGDDRKTKTSKHTLKYRRQFGDEYNQMIQSYAASYDKYKDQPNAAEGNRIARKPGQPANSKKHSDLYTDENPKGTITGLKFATVADAKASVTKIKNSGRSHAHKIQAAVAMEQRAKAAGKSAEADIYRKFIDSMKKKTNEYYANDMQFNPPELPVRYSYLSASYNKKFEEFSEAAGYRNIFKDFTPFQLDPTVQPLGSAVPVSRYDLESVYSSSKLMADKQRREKETLDKKHDREREQMKIQDLRRKMQKKSVEEAADSGLAKKAEKSGIPVGILRQVYNRGMAAWKTGHRPGASQQQWAYARVNSFITKGSGTWGGADKDLAARVRKESVNEAFGQMMRAADFEYKKEKLPDGRIVYRKVHKQIRAEGDPDPCHREIGTDSGVRVYKKDTPGQNESKQDTRYLAPVPWATQEAKDPGKSPQTYKDIRKTLSGIREQEELALVKEKDDEHDCGCGGNCQCDDVQKEELEITEAEYQGRKVTLNKPFRTPGGPKKSAVYTTNGAGKVVIVRFGDPNMTIKKNIPSRRSNFRARHNCDNPGPRWKARYWSCKAW